MTEDNGLSAITADMPISDILELVPDSVELMLGVGLHCIGCGANSLETLEQGMLGHGFPDDVVEQLVQDINLLYELQRSKQAKYEASASSSSALYAKTVDVDGVKHYALGDDMLMTQKAYDALHELATAPGLRIHIAAGGCSGHNYEYDYVDKQDHSEHAYPLSQRLAIYMDAFTTEKLEGTTIDFESGLKGAGLTFNNPNVRRTCHCGTSVKFA